MRLVADHDLGLEFAAERRAVSERQPAAYVLNDYTMAAGQRRAGIARGEIPEAARQPGGHPGPSDMSGGKLIAGRSASCEPEAELGSLLQHRIARALHRSCEREDIGVRIEPFEFSGVHDDENIGIVALAQSLARHRRVGRRGPGRERKGAEPGFGADGIKRDSFVSGSFA